MKPHRARCAFCGHIWYGYSRQEAWDYMMRHCHETPNHPIIEPYLVAIEPMRYWFWKFSDDKGRIEQIERHAVPDAMRRIEEYSPIV